VKEDVMKVMGQEIVDRAEAILRDRGADPGSASMSEYADALAAAEDEQRAPAPPPVSALQRRLRDEAVARIADALLLGEDDGSVAAYSAALEEAGRRFDEAQARAAERRAS
jgi:hypothetical protein